MPALAKYLELDKILHNQPFRGSQFSLQNLTVVPHCGKTLCSPKYQWAWCTMFSEYQNHRMSMSQRPHMPLRSPKGAPGPAQKVPTLTLGGSGRKRAAGGVEFYSLQPPTLIMCQALPRVCGTKGLTEGTNSSRTVRLSLRKHARRVPSLPTTSGPLPPGARLLHVPSNMRAA